MNAFDAYIALVGRMTTDQLNRSENDISSHLGNAIATFGLHPVLDTGGGGNRSKRPDISLYVDLSAADVAAAADVVIESKKPIEVAHFSSLKDALVSDEVWWAKFVPYVRAHSERVSYFILTTFERFLMIPIDSTLRNDIQGKRSYPDLPSRLAATSSSTRPEEPPRSRIGAEATYHPRS
jgi:hypothetical protein